MSKVVHTLILSSFFSISLYALDINSTNEIFKQATEATKELSVELEPIINESIESVIDENNITITEVKVENIEINKNIKDNPKPIEIEIETNSTKEITVDKNNTEENITIEKIEKVVEKDVVEKGDPRKGKNIFKYVLKDDCNMTAYKFAEKHTQEEWLELLEENKIKETIIKTCPNVKNYYQDKWTDDLYQFFYEASNEDEIPEC